MELIGGRRVRSDPGAPIDVRIRTIAERQRGRAGREQLLSAGVKRGAILRRVRNGRLELLHRSVYGLPETGDLPLAAETAALLACGDEAVLSHHSAATLWQLRPGIARPIHVTLIGDRGCPKLLGIALHRSRILTPSDIRVHEGLPVTSPARAVLDVSPSLTDRDIERLIDEGMFALRILTLADIRDVLARAGGHPGRARLARVADGRTRSTKTDSPPEEALLALIRVAGLPEPQLQVPILGYRLDFYWPRLRLAVEVDAYGTHGSPARFEADRRRDARLVTEKGIAVLRITKLAIETRPFEVIALLARAIAQREVELRAA